MRLHFVLSFLVARAACNRFECTDDSSFALQNRLPCEMWVGRNCWIAHEVLGYSAPSSSFAVGAVAVAALGVGAAVAALRCRRRRGGVRALSGSDEGAGQAAAMTELNDAAAAGQRMQRARAVDIEDISLHDEMRLKRAPGEFDDAIGDAAAAGRVPAGRVRTSDDVDGLD